MNVRINLLLAPPIVQIKNIKIPFSIADKNHISLLENKADAFTAPTRLKPHLMSEKRGINYQMLIYSNS